MSTHDILMITLSDSSLHVDQTVDNIVIIIVTFFFLLKETTYIILLFDFLLVLFTLFNISHAFYKIVIKMRNYWICHAKS